MIEYTFEERSHLKSHYIAVDGDAGVVLKGRKIDTETGDQFVLERAKWILNKLQTIKQPTKQTLVTGSRLPYLGKNYYVQVITDHTAKTPVVAFNHSTFKITLPPETQEVQVTEAIDQFYRTKAREKLTPRVRRLASEKKLEFRQLTFRTMTKRWGSCTPDNKIILNPNAVKLPYQLIDYLIIHELTHTKVKDHSKRFWRELGKHSPNWRELDQRLKDVTF